MIRDCIKSVCFADEVIVIDSGSSDKTILIAKKLGAKVYVNKFEDFAKQRNFGFSKAKSDWIFYLDADERVGEELKKEILSILDRQLANIDSYQIPRLNVFFGKKMRYGGWFPDYQTRLFKKNSLKGWYGTVHESAKVKGKIATLSNSLLHLTHRSLGDCFEKSIIWTKMEAELLFKAKHPKITIFNLIKVTFGEFFYRLFLKQGFRDGTVGWFEGLIQAFNKFLVYGQLWEKQQKSYR